jgi:patatin-like phospholipase/acyl hydrolase
MADGGGVRGLSSVKILVEIMRRVNSGRETPLEPWQVFNMMGGTSTGGLVKSTFRISRSSHITVAGSLQLCWVVSVCHSMSAKMPT